MIVNPGAFNRDQLDSLRSLEVELNRLRGHLFSGLYRGYFSSDVVTAYLPSGWTVAHTATGRYTVTHTLNIGTPERFIVLPTLITGNDSFFVNLRSVSADSFELNVYDETGAAVDCAIQFQASYILE